MITHPTGRYSVGRAIQSEMDGAMIMLEKHEVQEQFCTRLVPAFMQTKSKNTIAQSSIREQN
jgi:hypothetical protein